jgi:hypothetical protein
MKKAIFLICCMLAIHVHAQQFYFMPKVGYNMSGINTSLDNPRHGINAGVSFGYKALPRLSFETGVYYSMQGTSYKISDEPNFLDGVINIGERLSFNVDLWNDYINVPLLAKGYLYRGFHLYAGPQIGMLVHSSLNISSNLEVMDNDYALLAESIDLSDYERKVDVSGIIGVGYQFNMGLLVSANYNIGLAKLFHTEDMPYNADVNAKNNVMQVNIGWLF